MLDVVVFAEGDPENLAVTLTSLVPAVAEGFVRRGLVVDRSGNGDIRRVAEAAGCDFTTGTEKTNLENWQLRICSGAVLEDGWWRAASLYYERARLAEPHRRRPAVFTYAEKNYGVAPRLRELAVAALRSVPFMPATYRAVVLPPQFAKPGEAGSTMPLRISGRVETLRVRLFS